MIHGTFSLVSQLPNAKEKYAFDPKELLGEVTRVYLNLREKKEFQEAISRDERSYRFALRSEYATVA